MNDDRKQIAWLRLLSLILTIGLLTGCAAAELARSIDGAEERPDLIEIAERDRPLPRRIAVLPFVNDSDGPNAGAVVRCSFYNNLAARTYNDVELRRVEALLAREGLTDPTALPDQPVRRLGTLLGADGLVFGRVLTFQRTYLGAYSQVAVELEVRLVAVGDGREVWRARHRQVRREGDIPLSPIGVIPMMVRTMLNVQQIELLRTTDDLCRTLVAALPEPAGTVAPRKPAVHLVAHDAGGRPLGMGDTLTVMLHGDRGLTATFDLGALAKNLPMTEIEPGLYRGVYPVHPGDMLAEGLVVGHLVSADGLQTDWVEPLDPLTIDTRAPQGPERFEATGRDKRVDLDWTAVEDADLTAYRLYRSLSPRIGFQMVHETPATRYQDEDVQNGTSYYYRVTAVDAAGNESTPGEMTAALPLAPGPTPVAGDLDADTRWFAAAGPYVITEIVTVPAGVVLSIEAGTEIRSRGAGLVVRGTLEAEGRPDAAVLFHGEAHGRWDGIRFEPGAAGRLVHCRIEAADNALTVRGASPRIEACRIRGNRRGGVIGGDAWPVVTGNHFADNQGVGLLIEEAAPEVTDNRITGNTGGGVHCRGGSPTIRQNAIYDNGPFDLRAEAMGSAGLAAEDNWWGSADPGRIARRVQGPVRYASVLDAALPEGKPLALTASLDAQSLRRDLSRVRQMLSHGKFEKALTVLDRIAAARPMAARVHFLKGVALQGSDAPEAAADSMALAVDLAPEEVAYRMALALVYSGQGRPEDAAEQWRRVLEIDPDNAEARRLLEMRGGEKD